ncbi:hypothetical protein OAA86_09540 [Rhodospirillales bacterium]|nr:hypothetical protein [Rhodospirillales bacterium]
MLVDIEYAERLSPQLRLYRVTKPHPYVANFRCPICLDSKQDQKKARGYLYQKMNSLNFACHNCGERMSFSNFLKQIDPSLSTQHLDDRRRATSKSNKGIQR